MIKNCQNGEERADKVCNGVKDKSGCEDMDITYANGYQNGGGDEMGMDAI
jgi:hypothetical protein